MRAFIAKQPNGLYCRYSSIVDDFTHIDMTTEDYIAYRMEEARQDAIDTLEHHVKPFQKVIDIYCAKEEQPEGYTDLFKHMGYKKPLDTCSTNTPSSEQK